VKGWPARDLRCGASDHGRDQRRLGHKAGEPGHEPEQDEGSQD